MWIAILLTLTVPSVVYAVLQRKHAAVEALPLRGLVAGLIPMGVSAAWAVFFMIVYKDGYGEAGMLRMNAYKFLHYPLLAIFVPLSANLVWKRATDPLMLLRVALLGAFAAECILCEYTPVGWTFTFVLVPFAFLAMLIGFAFLRRKPTPSAGAPSP